MHMSLSKLQELMMDRKVWRAAVHGVTETQLSDWTELTSDTYRWIHIYICLYIHILIKEQKPVWYQNCRWPHQMQKNNQAVFFKITGEKNWKWFLSNHENRFNPWVGKIPWRKAWQPTPVFLPREAHGHRSLAGDSPWGHKESDTTEATYYAHTSMKTRPLCQGLTLSFTPTSSSTSDLLILLLEISQM